MKNIRAISLLICLVCLAISCKKQDAPPAPTPPVTPPVVPPVVIIPPAEYPGYSLLWNDEFNDTYINTQNWSYETGTGVNGDFGTGQLDRATDRKENVRIENAVAGASGGCLAIKTLKENYIDRNYTSARLSTSGKGSWGPGNRIEARIWARDVRYKGQGFAFWMMPAEIPANQTYIMWPQGGEIDIMEFVGSIPNYNLGTVHYAWAWENNQYQNWNHGHKGGFYSYKDAQVPAENPAYGGWPVSSSDTSAGSGGFHIYRIDWYLDKIEFSVDEKVYHIHYLNDGAAFDNGVADGEDQDAKETVGGSRVFKSEYSNHFTEWSPFEHKFFILLTGGVGGKDDMTYGGAIVPAAEFPCSTFIDWVRVYKRQ